MKKAIIKIIICLIIGTLVTTSISVGIENETTSGKIKNSDPPIEPCQECPHNLPTPPTIDGPSWGIVGVKYFYNFSSTADPPYNIFGYYVDWGDETNELHDNPFNHTWDTVGNYTMTVYSIDDSSDYCVSNASYKYVDILLTPPNQPPNEPTNPDPYDGKSGVGIRPTLSVYVSDPNGDALDVSFYEQSRGLIGTDTDVPSGSRAAIVWSGLNYNTEYSWYAIAKDTMYENQSETWTFTTTLSNNPPEISDPDPYDEETEIGVYPKLSVYVSDPNGDGIDVSFYEEDRGLIGIDTNVPNGSRASIYWSGLDYDTTYNWYVVANDTIDETQSDTWSFTTGADWWPMFHHDPAHTGYSTSSSSTPNVKWIANINPGRSSLSVVDGKIYTGGGIHCVDAEDGALNWSAAAGGGGSTPAIADGRVYVGSVDANIYCLYATNGTKIWNYTTGGYIAYSSPAVVDGKVYFGSRDKNIYCLDASDGTKIWNYITDDSVEYSSPAVVGGRVYIGSSDKNVYCLYASNGTKIWNYTANGRIIDSPTIADGKVYFGGFDDDHNVYCLYASNGTKIWNYTTDDNIESTPAIAYGNVYIGSGDGNVYCLDATDGAKIWSYQTESYVTASPAVADGRVYIGSLDENIYCLDASDGSLIWKHLIGGNLWSSPAIADGKLYIGSTSGLYCFGGDALPPNKPTITGPTTGDLNELYEYTVTATEPEGQNISYYVDWGDNSSSGWTDYVPSGTEVTFDHIWSEAGTYNVIAKVKDIPGNQNQSDPLTVTITNPVLEITIKSGFSIGPKAVIKNTGTGDAIDVNWTINVTGGIFEGIDEAINGNIAKIEAGKEETIPTRPWLFLGFGPINITAVASAPDPDVATVTVEIQGAQVIILTIVKK